MKGRPKMNRKRSTHPSGHESKSSWVPVGRVYVSCDAKGQAVRQAIPLSKKRRFEVGSRLLSKHGHTLKIGTWALDGMGLKVKSWRASLVIRKHVCRALFSYTAEVHEMTPLA